MILERIVDGQRVPWVLEDGDGKLDFRATLPGAFGFDQAAHVLRSLQAEGARAIDLLSHCRPAGW